MLANSALNIISLKRWNKILSIVNEHIGHIVTINRIPDGEPQEFIMYCLLPVADQVFHLHVKNLKGDLTKFYFSRKNVKLHKNGQKLLVTQLGRKLEFNMDPDRVILQ